MSSEKHTFQNPNKENQPNQPNQPNQTNQLNQPTHVNAESGLPNDLNALNIAVKNLFTALNKANKSGAFDLMESSQIMNDITLISTVINHVTKESKRQ